MRPRSAAPPAKHAAPHASREHTVYTVYMYVGRTENFSPFEADEKRLNSDKVLPSRTSKVNLLVLLKRYLSQHLYFLSLGKEKNYSLLESPILFDTVNLSLHEQNLQDTGTCSDGRCHIPDCFCKSLTRTREFSF